MKNIKNGILLLMIWIIILFINEACMGKVDKFIYKSPDFENFKFEKKEFDKLLDSIPIAQEYNISGLYISEVVFINKNDLQLTFQTLDGRASKNMHIESAPEGLSQGEKVRIYYYMNSNSTLQRSDEPNISEIFTLERSIFQIEEIWFICGIEKL